MALVDLKKHFLREYHALPESYREGPLFLALSGGKDSTVLAHVALSLKTRLPPIHFLHVNYHLRGKESDLEEIFLREWARKAKVPIWIKALRPKRKPKNLQDWARRERYQFFQGIISKKGKGEGILCVAHHRQDQEETILMRLLTGGGLKALGGMRGFECNGFGVPCFRPFLGVSPAALATYRKSRSLKICHDSSNDRLDYLRNRIRHRLLPAMAAENRKVGERLISLGRQCREAQEALELMALQRLNGNGQNQGAAGKSLDRALLSQCPKAMQGAILEQFLRPHLSKTRNMGRTLEAVAQALQKGRPRQDFPLPEGRQLKLLPETLRIIGKKADFSRDRKRRGRGVGKSEKP